MMRYIYCAVVGANPVIWNCSTCHICPVAWGNCDTYCLSCPN